MRATVRLSAGFVSPHREDRLTFLPALGRHVLAWLVGRARADARRRFGTTCSRAIRRKERDVRALVSHWYLVERLLEGIQATIPSPATSLPRLPAGRLARDDLWRTLGLFATWSVREADTRRFADVEAAMDQKTPAAKIQSPFSRRGLRARVQAYAAARTPPALPPEHQNHNPLEQLNRAATSALDRAKASPQTVRAALDAAWNSSVQKVLSRPAPDDICLLLSLLVQLFPDEDVRSHDLDFTVEGYLDGVALELSRRHVHSLLDQEVGRGSASRCVERALAEDLANHLAQALEDERMPAEKMVTKLTPLVASALSRRRREVRGVFSAPNLEAATSAAERLTKRTVEGLRDAIARIRPKVDVRRLGHIWSQSRLQPMCDAAVAFLHEASPFTFFDMTARRREVASLIVERLYAHRRQPITVDATVPTNLYSPAAAAATSPLPGLATRGAVGLEWRKELYARKRRRGERVDPDSIHVLRPMPGERRVRPSDELDDTLFLHYPNLNAATVTGAAHLARRAAAAELSLLWLTTDTGKSLELLGKTYLRRTSTETLHMHTTPSTALSLPFDIPQARVAGLNELLSKVRSAMNSSAQGEIARRVLASAMFLRMGADSVYPHEQYLYIWLSLEALFNGLEHDSLKGSRDTPIGTRVAHRVASMLDPKPNQAGRTYGDFQWALATELQALYRLRCETVHAGQYATVVNEELRNRWKAIAIDALARVVSAAILRGARSVDEVLAFQEGSFPASSSIP